MKKPLLIDGHEDLAYNMALYNRDYRRNLAEIRELEKNKPFIKSSGTATLAWDVWQEARAGIIFGTLFVLPERRIASQFDTLIYTNAEEAHFHYHHQIENYHELTAQNPDQFKLLLNKTDFKTHWTQWQNASEDEELPVGIVILMEGADGIRTPEEVHEWWEAGLRIIGLAWAGTRYSGGTREPGPLTPEGFQLLDEMQQAGFILDLSHMDELAVFQALERYEGEIIVSHSSAKALVPRDTNRFLSDRMIEGIIERDGVIGVVPYNLFLNADFVLNGDRTPITIEDVATQIDYICQIAGNTNHIAIGSDFDGGFGLENIPSGMDNLADIHQLIPVLENKGYNQADINAIFHGNWHRKLAVGLPD